MDFSSILNIENKTLKLKLSRLKKKNLNMDRLLRKNNVLPTSISLVSTVGQRYLKCNTVIGKGFCQQVFIKMDDVPASLKGA